MEIAVLVTRLTSRRSCPASHPQCIVVRRLPGATASQWASDSVSAVEMLREANTTGGE
jgi:hypothetical protein